MRDHPDYPKMTREQRLRARLAIAAKRKEGIPEAQAVAEAMEMARDGRLDEHGGYVHVPKVHG